MSALTVMLWIAIAAVLAVIICMAYMIGLVVGTVRGHKSALEEAEREDDDLLDRLRRVQ